MNDEVVKRLERSFGPDDAVLQLAEILQPFFASLDEADRATLITAARILAKNRRKKPAGLPRPTDLNQGDGGTEMTPPDKNVG